MLCKCIAYDMVLKRHVVAMWYVLWPSLHNGIFVNQYALASSYTCSDAWRHVSGLQLTRTVPRDTNTCCVLVS
jgi:hypothetical protein